MTDAPTKIGLHDYRTDPLLPQRDGVNLAHENFAQLLRECDDPRLDVTFHDFGLLMSDRGIARRTLEPLDCVLANVGPHAHYYFWLREELGLDFRIVRDVRTAIWSSYLLQEHLVAPLLRDDDTLLVASNYTWAIYERIFAGLRNRPATICYPLSIAFPDERPGVRVPPSEKRLVVLGYLGRLSDDKNFPDLVDLVITLNRKSEGERQFRLLACGEVHSPSCEPAEVARRLEGELGPGEWFEYRPTIRNSEIWDLFGQFDYMLFPSTSNLETFGRVLIEASYARLPVIAGDHAAAAELVDPRGIVPVTYRTDEAFPAHFDHRLGAADVAAMADAIADDAVKASASFKRYAKHDKVLFDTLTCAPGSSRRPDLSPSQARFISELDVTIPDQPCNADAKALIGELAAWFLRLQDKGAGHWEETIRELLERSRFKERTQRFIRKARASSGDFTNVGGIDIEMCHIANFYPEFRLGCEVPAHSGDE